MVFFGIDVAKDKHDCHVVNSDGVILCDNFSFANSDSGFSAFLESANSWDRLDDIKVGLEANGHYSSNLLSFLKAHGFQVAVFNPLSVSKLRTASAFRRSKTDINDSRYIARLLTLPLFILPYFRLKVTLSRKISFVFRNSTPQKPFQTTFTRPVPRTLRLF